jgi:hypothetical protein
MLLPCHVGAAQTQTLRFSATRIIGNGSFGVVYEARIVDTGEQVAIKKVLQDKRFKVRAPSPAQRAAARTRATCAMARVDVAAQKRTQTTPRRRVVRRTASSRS